MEKEAEPVLLAALLSEEPLLLVGAHGCAKSLCWSALRKASGMAFRSYNASLINYDDLVGVPMPDATRTKLPTILRPRKASGTPRSFIDEITSRTRPELQNKLFPIIYDRVGVPSSRFVYRWAAMNPPTDEELEGDDALYLGLNSLDAALADRFPYILSVPDWDDLSPVRSGRRSSRTSFCGRHEFPAAGPRARRRSAYALRGAGAGTDAAPTSYVVTLVPKLRAAHRRPDARRPCSR